MPSWARRLQLVAFVGFIPWFALIMFGDPWERPYVTLGIFGPDPRPGSSARFSCCTPLVVETSRRLALRLGILLRTEGRPLPTRVSARRPCGACAFLMENASKGLVARRCIASKNTGSRGRQMPFGGAH